MKDSVIYSADKGVLVGNSQKNALAVGTVQTSAATNTAVSNPSDPVIPYVSDTVLPPVVKVDASTASFTTSAVRPASLWTHFGTISSERSLSGEKFNSRNLVLGKVH